MSSIATSRAAGTGAPVLDMDPYDLDVLRDPYEFHCRLRDAGPIAFIPKYGVYATGRYAEVSEVFADHGRFTASGGVGIQDIRQPGDFRVPNRLLENDPPSHTELRSVLMRLFSPRLIRSWREKFETEAALVIDAIVAKGEFDGVSDVAEAFILRVFADALGLTLPRENVLAIGEMRFNQSGPKNALYDAAMKRAAPYLQWFEDSTQRENVAPGSVSEQLFVLEDEGAMERGVASNMLRSFVGGGTDSTIAAVGHTLNLLAQNPQAWAALKTDPARVKSAFEEALRLQSPFQVTYRTTVNDTVLSGLHLPANSKVGLFLGAANRDPRKWPEPDRFDISRDLAGIHLGFGHGAHICIGQMIARLEAETILKVLVETADNLEPAGEPVYRPINQMRQLERLPLRVNFQPRG